MTLTYIFHSGFVLETEQSILVFDYWLDPSGVIGGVLKKDKPGETIYSEELTEQRGPSSSHERPSRDGSRQSQFEEEIDPIAHEKQYLGELKDIRKVADGFDLVMFPIDGRIGNGYTLGGRQFIERFKVGMFVPMHFVASGFESSWRMKEFTDEKGISFWEITKEGETIEL